MKVENFYIARLVYEIQVQHQQENFQFDEQVVLIEAASEAQALVQAKLLGVKNEFTTGGNQTAEVQWNFIDVIDLKPFTLLSNGIEICSKIEEHPEGNAYTRFVKTKAHSLEEKLLPQKVSQ